MHHYYFRIIERYKSWLSNSRERPESSEAERVGSSTLLQNDCTVSPEMTLQKTEFKMPDFPLFPVSKGFCKCLERNIELFSKTLADETSTLNGENS